MYRIPSSTHKPLISTLPVSEYVRLSQIKPTFKKGYTIQNTLEIFKITHVDTTQSPTIYFLEDLRGEPIKDLFYREELIPTAPPEFYQIDIIRTTTVAGRKKYLVKWRGYPDRFNSLDRWKSINSSMKPYIVKNNEFLKYFSQLPQKKQTSSITDYKQRSSKYYFWYL